MFQAREHDVSACIIIIIKITFNIQNKSIELGLKLNTHYGSAIPITPNVQHQYPFHMYNHESNINSDKKDTQQS